MNKSDEQNIVKRMEVLGDAVQTALESILEIQAEYKLISYLLINKKEEE